MSKHRFCVSDEHYIPTLLAHLGLAGETNCRFSVAYTRWAPPNSPHPWTWQAADVSGERRPGCMPAGLTAGAGRAQEGCSWLEARGRGMGSRTPSMLADTLPGPREEGP